VILNYEESPDAMIWDLPDLIPMDQFFDKLREGLIKYGSLKFDEFNDFLEKTHHLILLLEDQGLERPNIELASQEELAQWRKKAKSITL
jgi:hypothetical protein